MDLKGSVTMVTQHGRSIDRAETRDTVTSGLQI